MGEYAIAAGLYDLLYAGAKDYRAEAEQLDSIIHDAGVGRGRLLDVACGTGEHARHLVELGYEVDGLDIEPAFAEIARAKVPSGSFEVADMVDFALPGRYDAVVCLFSAIGYVVTVERLRSAIRSMAAHLSGDGVLVVEPWFEPGQLTDGWITMVTGATDDTKACRMSRTLIEGRRSVLEFEYLVGETSGIGRASETHTLGLFTREEMEGAFREAGLDVVHRQPGLRNRGLYIGGHTDR